MKYLFSICLFIFVSATSTCWGQNHPTRKATVIPGYRGEVLDFQAFTQADQISLFVVGDKYCGPCKRLLQNFMDSLPVWDRASKVALYYVNMSMSETAGDSMHTHYEYMSSYPQASQEYEKRYGITVHPHVSLFCGDTAYSYNSIAIQSASAYRVTMAAYTKEILLKHLSPSFSPIVAYAETLPKTSPSNQFVHRETALQTRTTQPNTSPAFSPNPPVSQPVAPPPVASQSDKYQLYLKHVVIKGETVYSISRNYGVDIEVIQHDNVSLKNINQIKRRESLYIRVSPSQLERTRKNYYAKLNFDNNQVEKLYHLKIERINRKGNWIELQIQHQTTP